MRRAVSLLVALLVALALPSSVPRAAHGTTHPPSPFRDRTLYVDPHSPAARDAAALAQVDPAAARALEAIAARPHAEWFGDWNPTDRLASDVSARVTAITNARSYPVLVAYNIPQA